MSYKTITICLDGSKDLSRNMKFAIGLATQYDAHLRGLILTYTPPFIFDPTGQYEPLMIELEEAQIERQKKIQRVFDTEVKLSGLSFDSMGIQVNNTDEIADFTRASDLVILGQCNPDDNDRSIPSQSFAQHLLTKLGRPLLLLPGTGNLPSSIDRIMIAWDGSKESGRAITDAMPFLQNAKSVKLLTIINHVSGQKYLPNVDIASYLARHEVKIEIDEQECPIKEPSTWLLANASKYGANLLVMGGYGHSRLSELIMGGMTQSIFADITLPTLMSH